MLIITRCKQQAIIINDDIEVVILGVQGQQVRLGITAPREIPVHREEIYQLIQQQKAEKEKAA